MGTGGLCNVNPPCELPFVPVQALGIRERGQESPVYNECCSIPSKGDATGNMEVFKLIGKLVASLVISFLISEFFQYLLKKLLMRKLPGLFSPMHCIKGPASDLCKKGDKLMFETVEDFIKKRAKKAFIQVRLLWRRVVFNQVMSGMLDIGLMKSAASMLHFSPMKIFKANTRAALSTLSRIASKTGVALSMETLSMLDSNSRLAIRDAVRRSRSIVRTATRAQFGSAIRSSTRLVMGAGRTAGSMAIKGGVKAGTAIGKAAASSFASIGTKLGRMSVSGSVQAMKTAALSMTPITAIFLVFDIASMILDFADPLDFESFDELSNTKLVQIRDRIEWAVHAAGINGQLTEDQNNTSPRVFNIEMVFPIEFATAYERMQNYYVEKTYDKIYDATTNIGPYGIMQYRLKLADRFEALYTGDLALLAGMTDDELKRIYVCEPEEIEKDAENCYSAYDAKEAKDDFAYMAIADMNANPIERDRLIVTYMNEEIRRLQSVPMAVWWKRNRLDRVPDLQYGTDVIILTCKRESGLRRQLWFLPDQQVKCYKIADYEVVGAPDLPPSMVDGTIDYFTPPRPRPVMQNQYAAYQRQQRRGQGRTRTGRRNRNRGRSGRLSTTDSESSDSEELVVQAVGEGKGEGEGEGEGGRGGRGRGRKESRSR